MSTLFVNNLNTASGSTITVPTGKKLVGTDGGGISAPGMVVQTVKAITTTDTAVTTSGSFVDIPASQCSITSKLANSSFLYQATISAEGDASSNFNTFQRMVYTVNGGSTVQHTSTRTFNFTAVLDSMGTVNNHISYLFDGLTEGAGTVFVFAFQHRQNTTGSYHFNQQSLTNQPSGTSNMSHITVQEIAQ